MLVYALHNQWIQLQECGARKQPITQSQPMFHLLQGLRCYHASSRHLKWVGIPYIYIYAFIYLFIHLYVYIYIYVHLDRLPNQQMYQTRPGRPFPLPQTLHMLSTFLRENHVNVNFNKGKNGVTPKSSKSRMAMTSYWNNHGDLGMPHDWRMPLDCWRSRGSMLAASGPT